MPHIDVSIYAGSSADEAIVRMQANEKISCANPDIEDFRCLRSSDLKRIYEAFFLCEKWKPGTKMMGEMDYFRYIMLLEAWR